MTIGTKQIALIELCFYRGPFSAMAPANLKTFELRIFVMKTQSSRAFTVPTVFAFVTLILKAHQLSLHFIFVCGATIAYGFSMTGPLVVCVDS